MGTYCKKTSDAVATCENGCNGDGRCANAQKCCGMTCVDPQSDAAQGRYIGTQVAGVNIVYVTQTADDGTTSQAIQQIELSYDDSTSVSVVDLNGERRVDVADDAGEVVRIITEAHNHQGLARDQDDL